MRLSHTVVMIKSTLLEALISIRMKVGGSLEKSNPLLSYDHAELNLV